jgi:hypothetical protein
MQDALAPIVVELLGMLPKTDEIFVFASGKLRGKLITTSIYNAYPSNTYGRPVGTEREPCLVVDYTPCQKVPPPGMNPYKFTRKPVSFIMPIGVVDEAVYLEKVENGKWMLNLNTTVKD